MKRDRKYKPIPVGHVNPSLLVVHSATFECDRNPIRDLWITTVAIEGSIVKPAINSTHQRPQQVETSYLYKKTG